MIIDEWSANLLGVETLGFALRPGFGRVRVWCASVSVCYASVSVASASVSMLSASVSPHVPVAALGVAVIWLGYLAAVP